MRRITINALVDIGCLITFIPSLVSGLVLFFVLPSGSGRGHAEYLGLFHDPWLNIHNYWSLAFSAILIIHLILRWMYFRNIRKCLAVAQKEAEAFKT